MGDPQIAGVLHGVGLGPGDPELVTLRAFRLISGAEVVAYPAPLTDAGVGESFARGIAASFIPDDAEEIVIAVPMRAERHPAQEVYDAAAEAIAAVLSEGRDVVVLCEGDPFFYGSFMYLFGRLADRFDVEVTPGVASLTACACAAGTPLCARNEPLVVLPGTLSDAELAERLRGDGAAAIIKVGRHAPRLKALLATLGLADRARYVAHASLPMQAVASLSDAPDDAPYFSMILVPGADPYAHG